MLMGDKMYQWKKGTAYNSVVTIYPSNLTLNIVAAGYFNEVRFCMLGYDKSEGKVAIRPVSKNEIDLKLVPLENLYKIFQGKSYSRISCKALIDEIKENFTIAVNGNKFYTSFDEEDEMLIIDLKKEVG